MSQKICKRQIGRHSIFRGIGKCREKIDFFFIFGTDRLNEQSDLSVSELFSLTINRTCSTVNADVPVQETIPKLT